MDWPSPDPPLPWPCTSGLSGSLRMNSITPPADGDPWLDLLALSIGLQEQNYLQKFISFAVQSVCGASLPSSVEVQGQGMKAISNQTF